MKKKHTKKAAKKIIKIAINHPEYYTSEEVQFAKLILASLKKQKK